MLTVVCVSNFWWGFCQQISAYLHTKILFRAPDVYLSRDCVCRQLILSCYVLSTLLKNVFSFLAFKYLTFLCKIVPHIDFDLSVTRVWFVLHNLVHCKHNLLFRWKWVPQYLVHFTQIGLVTFPLLSEIQRVSTHKWRY